MTHYPPTRRRPRGMLNEPDIRAVPVYIYALCEPDTGEVRYIGRSSNPRGRAVHHRTGDSRRMVLWYAELAHAGKRPALRILRTVQPGDDSTVAEVAAIAAHASERLLNGRGPGTRTLRAVETVAIARRLRALGVHIDVPLSTYQSAARRTQ